jgi:hypothetical protein
MNNDILNELKNESDCNSGVMYVYPAIETETDPTEHTVALAYLNPIPIEIIYRDMSLSSLKWNYEGQIKIGSKEILCDLNYESLLKICHKITINDEEYRTYKDASGFGILRRKDYLVVIAEKI